MCGIFGWSVKPGALSDVQKAALAAVLAVSNDNRGGDSWGFCSSVEDNLLDIKRGLKEIAPQALVLSSADTLIAHTRKATTGEKTVENAHPFEIGDIIGAHNGTISNHDDLKKKYKRESFKVDSMHLFAHISEGRRFKDIAGYGAIEWMERNKPHAVFLCKLYNGDLNIYGIGDPDMPEGIIWSSKKDHLETAITSARIVAFAYTVSVGQVYRAEGGILYTDPRKLFLRSKKSYSSSSSSTTSGNSWQSHKDDYGAPYYNQQYRSGHGWHEKDNHQKLLPGPKEEKKASVTVIHDYDTTPKDLPLSLTKQWQEMSQEEKLVAWKELRQLGNIDDLENVDEAAFLQCLMERD